MKDKEKQIDCDTCVYKEMCFYQEEITNCNEWAKEFQCEYYKPKLPKDSVVLSREEYSNYLITQTNNEWLKEQAEKLQADNERLYENLGKFKQSVSKDTAKKFLQLAYDRCLEKSFIKKVEELAKQFGVEIKE